MRLGLGHCSTRCRDMTGMIRQRGVFHLKNNLTRDADSYGVMPQLSKKNPALKTYQPTYGWARSAYQSAAVSTVRASWLKAFGWHALAHIGSDERVVSTQHQR